MRGDGNRTTRFVTAYSCLPGSTRQGRLTKQPVGLTKQPVGLDQLRNDDEANVVTPTPSPTTAAPLSTAGGWN